ncbi:sialidase family protein [Sandarakinorhabdus limnophila]|uniref:WD40/YVTN/BNR-like repeat-containing protein n=1 Tax=Sandarakinorhabdus limnophila TaxID=210512 RepID=UPI0026F2C23D|nr:sialidase family protein [Sandarakinorhabdus limnophila]
MSASADRLKAAFWLARAATAAVMLGSAAFAAAPDGLVPDDLKALEWREVGTAMPSGRIARFAVHPTDQRIIYAASASGGLWKTVNAGATWTPIFERQGSVSMGAVTLDPKDPNTVWLGTGEQNNVRSSLYGDGVYRSKDGGATWEHMGLRDSRHIGRILVHPDDSNTVYVAALGSLWGPGEERGLYRTRDGGKTWTRLLRPSQFTGVVEVAMHPTNPNILYAATFQRERRQWSMIGGGTEGGLWRSTDGGDTWARVGNGFPTTAAGRVGVTFCPGKPDMLYATAVGPDGGTFRSTDGGTSWERRNKDVQSHWYYGEVFCDPMNPERIYVPTTPLSRSDDGGKTFTNVLKGQVHADNHTMWINPKDSNHLILGNDGGMYTSRDGGQRWTWQSNLPLMQLYTVAADMQEPFYHVYGGTQDNGSWGGPIGTRFDDGIANEDFLFLSGGDGFYAVADPTDSDIIYSQSQYGGLVRTNRKSMAQKRIQPWQPQKGEFPPYRWNWSAPFVISPHDPKTLYFGANVVFRSRDRGDTWERISPDLTRQLSRDALPLQGKIQPANAIDLHSSTALYGNTHSLSVSTMRPGLLAAGTDDGLIQVSRDDGRTWVKSSVFPGVANQKKVGMVAWSSTNEGTLVAVFDGHQDNDFAPHVVRSDDFGATWRNITADLPAFGPTKSIAVHSKNGELLFVGTDMGVYFSRDGGGHWLPLRSGLPTNSVQGLMVHPRENDLVIGTHGRGFWVLDDINLVEKLTPEVVASHSYLAPLRRGTQIRDVPRGRKNAGNSYFTTKNPPRGAIIDYWLGSAAVGQKVSIEIMDGNGRLVRSLAQPAAARGAQRAVWDLRFEAPPNASMSEYRRMPGRFVMPGTYQVKLTVGEEVHMQPLAVRLDPAISLSAADSAALDAVGATQARLVAATYHANKTLAPGLSQLTATVKALKDAKADRKLVAQAEAALKEAERLNVILNGREEGIAQQETFLPLAELTQRLYTSTQDYSAAPDPAQRQLTASAEADVKTFYKDLGVLVSDTLPAVQNSVTAAGMAWPGELPRMPVQP